MTLKNVSFHAVRVSFKCSCGAPVAGTSSPTSALTSVSTALPLRPPCLCPRPPWLPDDAVSAPPACEELTVGLLSLIFHWGWGSLQPELSSFHSYPVKWSYSWLNYCATCVFEQSWVFTPTTAKLSCCVGRFFRNTLPQTFQTFQTWDECSLHVQVEVFVVGSHCLLCLGLCSLNCSVALKK